MILRADGKPYKVGDGGDIPTAFKQPPLQIAGRFKKKEQFEAVVQLHKLGDFQTSTWLVEQMMSAARVSSAMQTRTAGVVGTPLQFLPGKDNDKGRRVAKICEEEDFLLMCPPPAREEMHAGGIMSGVRLAQKHWYFDSGRGRWIPRAEPFNTQWVKWDWAAYAYRVWTWDGGWQLVPSPSVTVPSEGWSPTASAGGMKLAHPRSWVVYEPYGAHGWRSDFALVSSLWEPYFGYALANNDQNRICEKQGRGQLVWKYPKSTDKEARDTYIQGLLDVGPEGVFPLEQYGGAGSASYETPANMELEPFAWPATGYDIVAGTKSDNGGDITIRILGHNTSSETKGATGTQGGAQSGTLIRGDIRVADTMKENTWIVQVLRDWAEVNFGDPELAPRLKYVTEEPMANVAAAQTVNFLGTSVDSLDRHGVDTPELIRRFQLPLRPDAQGAGFKPAPPPAKSSSQPPTAPNAEAMAAMADRMLGALPPDEEETDP
jgi:hypothetical protein